MRGTEVVKCSRRLLVAMRSGSSRALKRELAEAERVLQTPLPSTLAEEQADLLDAIVQRRRISLAGYDPYAEAEVFLLGHLANA